MVQWSDSERRIIDDVWAKINVNETGPEAFARVLVVYPWTQRYFDSFGDVSSAAAVMRNAKVADHGKVVLNALENAVKYMDDIENSFAALSRLHCERLKVDPDDFKLLANCLTIVLATRFKSSFTSEVQATWQKFLSVVVAALGSQYV